MTLRKLLIVGAVLAIAVPAAAHGTTKRSSSVNVRRLANLYQIDQLEVKWHKATSKKDLALMMSIHGPERQAAEQRRDLCRESGSPEGVRPRGSLPAPESLGLGHACLQDSRDSERQ
jgi:hypothetical protein